jgi:hypothetical protein
MGYKKFLVLSFILICLAFVVAIPEDLNINGELTNSDGDPLDGTYPMTFKIYDVQEVNRKIYIWQNLNFNEMFPSDPFGSLDVFLSEVFYGF